MNYKTHDTYTNANSVYGQLYSDSSTPTNRATVSPYVSDTNNDINQSQRLGQPQLRPFTTSSQIITSLSSSVSKPVYSSSHLNQISNDQKQFGNQYSTQKLDSVMQPKTSESNLVKNHETMPTSNLAISDYYQGYTQTLNNPYRQENVLPNQTMKPEQQYHAQTQGYQVQKPLMSPTSNPYMNSVPQDSQSYPQSPTDAPRSTYQQGYYQPQPASAMSGRPQMNLPLTQSRSLDEPISSGPPRTNVLGIIPYATVCNNY